MKYLRLFLFALIASTTSGCAFIYSLDRNLLEQVEQWQKQHEYSRALDTIAVVSKSHPQYAQLQKKKQELIEEAERFEKIRMREINAHIEAGDWQAAESSLNDTLEKLPDSEIMQERYREFMQLRAQHLKSLYYQLYINKAEWLVKNKDVQRELSRTIPNDRNTRQSLQKHKEETEKVYKQLIICGIEAQNVDDLELAEQCYLLAEELKPSETTRAIITTIQKELTRRAHRETLVLSKRSQQRLDKAKQLMQSGKLRAAHSLYLKIRPRDRNHALVRAFKQELDKRIAANVKSRIETGRKLYSQGEIEQALAVWNEVRKLDPHNEYLNNHIDRAQRVLDKVNQIKEQEKAVVPGK